MLRIYFFIVLLLVVVISGQIAIRSFFLSPNSRLISIVPPIPFWEKETKGEPIDFDFFAAIFRRVRLSQGYGATRFAQLRYPSRWHNGVDIAARVGSAVHSPAPGAVTMVGDQDKYCPRHGYGKFAAVKNAEDGSVILYAHLSAVQVKTGQKIKEGQVIGLTGSTGFSTAPHLHVSVFRPGTFHVVDNKSCGPSPEGKDTNPITYFESQTPIAGNK